MFMPQSTTKHSMHVSAICFLSPLAGGKMVSSFSFFGGAPDLCEMKMCLTFALVILFEQVSEL